MLSLQSIHQFYGSSHTLRGLNLEVRKGALTVLLGRNGVGKTTLLRSIMGQTALRSGEILLDQQPIQGLQSHERVAAGIGYVPQGREIFPRLTVEENLLVGAASRKTTKAVNEQIYELFPVLKQMRQRNGGDLSGGQQQQLAIGRALMSQPKLLILDEPTEGIQPNVIQMIGETLKTLVLKNGLTVLLVEQYYEFARQIADDYAVMSRGEIIATGAAAHMERDGVEKLITV
jgi:urea transport system ATP-binding protein